ncbi:hypothetical protein PG993_010980 [Apiospora rasikravindrae]|uniref:Deoxyribonuclease NucA/NucB domain-containing protein n=1 Tax=Apiospora rasikravindrae TaxID=990691 RepID=A0ABR1SCX7_9PEZI
MRATTVSLLSLAAAAAGNPLGELEVCSNMCWGAYCVPSSTTSLVYDKASKSKKRERRKAAGCIDNQKPGNNRCSQGRPGAIKGYNCDEYPFASSKANTQSTNGKENRCSRCVPSSQNSKQGATLSQGYRDFCKNNAPCTFQVFFGNPGATGTDHCNVGPGQCNQDNAEQCTGSINIIERRQREWVTSPLSLERRALYTNGTYVPGPVQFRTVGGQLLDAPYGGTIGQPVHRPRAVNQTLHEELLARHAEANNEDNDDDGQFDEITANMVSDVDYIQEVTWEARLKE